MLIKFSRVIDFIFKTILIWFICLCVLKSFHINNVASLVIAGVISLTIIYLLNLLQTKKNKKITNAREHSKQLELITKTLLCSTTVENIQFLKKIFDTLQFTKTKDNYLWENASKTYYVPAFGSPTLTQEKFWEILKNKRQNTKVIKVFCIDADLQVINSCMQFDLPKIEIINIKDLYQNYILEKQITPNTNVKFSPKKIITLKIIINYAFDKKKAKGYFGFGLLLFVSSFFVFYNLYYLFFSALLFSFALICLLKRNRA